jgi:hypothetical protein
LTDSYFIGLIWKRRGYTVTETNYLNIRKSSLECLVLTKIWSCRQLLVTLTYIEYHENPCCERLAVLCVRTDRHDEADIDFWLSVLRVCLKEFTNNQIT